MVYRLSSAVAKRLENTRLTRTRVAAGLCSCLLALPSGLVVLIAVALGISIEIAIIAIVAPRLFPYCSRIVSERLRSDYVLSAECLGISRPRILMNHLLPGILPEIAGLFSLSIVTALGVSVAVEVLGARSGLGQLAWRAAMDRDMPVVLAVTMVVLLVVRVGTSTSDLLFEFGQRRNNAELVNSSVDSHSMRVALRA
jgi:ABC-type dipeptide/oligopeptide/nickel transport system permease component